MQNKEHMEKVRADIQKNVIDVHLKETNEYNLEEAFVYSRIAELEYFPSVF